MKPFITFCKRMFLAFGIFSLYRILFYLFNFQRFDSFSITPFLYGPRFDAVSIFYLFAPFILLSVFTIVFPRANKIERPLKTLFHIGNLLGILLNGVDIIYYGFTYKRTTADIFQFVQTGNDTTRLLPQFFADYWHVVLLAILSVALTEYLYRYTNSTISNVQNKISQKIAAITLILLLSLLAVRGGIQEKPLNIIDAGRITDAKNSPLILNTPFTILKTILEKDIETVTYFSEQEAKQQFHPLQEIKGTGKLGGKNVVIIILESFAAEYIGFYNSKSPYTPFLDSLLKQSSVMNASYANGKKSIEALPAIFSGIPGIMSTPYNISYYAGNQIDGLPAILSKKGYSSAFFHGGENGTMNFNGFCGMAGFNSYFGRDEYPKNSDYDGNWGIFDRPYLQFFADKISNLKEPFISSIFTLSSHHPYTLQDGFSPKHTGSLPIHPTIQYTDHALKLFFEKAKSTQWFKNTLFVITADHTAQLETKRYNSYLGNFEVPIAFYYPGDLSIKIPQKQNIFQHVDITPTILDLLGYKGNIVSFGTPYGSNWNIQLVNNLYQLTYEGYLLFFDGNIVTAFYDTSIGFDKPIEQQNMNSIQLSSYKRMLKIVKSVIQQHNNRMKNNQLSDRL